MTLRRCRSYVPVMALSVVVVTSDASDAGQRLMQPDAAYREVSRTGYLLDVQIAGDIDLSRLQVPTGVMQIDLQEVHIQGRVYSSAAGPEVPLLIKTSKLQQLDLSNVRLRQGFSLEGSTVKGLAHFDHGRFDGPFTLHATVFSSGAIFRGARFGGAVEIVGTRFEKPSGASGWVSFADARFTGPARFDHSRFAGDVRFDTSRFEADASFIDLDVSGRATWRNVIFSRDAEFRFCRLGDADFGDANETTVFVTVFGGLADFRGCTMRSARFDYVDGRGDMMLVNARVSPGDLTLRNALLRGGIADFSGLHVAGRLNLQGTHISALQFRWSELAGALKRAGAQSDVLRPLYQRLDDLKRNEEARSAWAMLAEQVFRERIADPDLGVAGKATLWLEWLCWGWPTRYGTQLERIVVFSLVAWLLVSLPLLICPRMQVGYWQGPPAEAPQRHQAASAEELQSLRGNTVDRCLQMLAYSFGLMFATPGLRLRPTGPLPWSIKIHLVVMRSLGALLLTLMGLTLANVSPVFQAILGKVAG